MALLISWSVIDGRHMANEDRVLDARQPAALALFTTGAVAALEWWSRQWMARDDAAPRRWAAMTVVAGTLAGWVSFAGAAIAADAGSVENFLRRART